MEATLGQHQEKLSFSVTAVGLGVVTSGAAMFSAKEKEIQIAL